MCVGLVEIDLLRVVLIVGVLEKHGLQSPDVLEALEDSLLGDGSVLPVVGGSRLDVGEVFDEAVYGAYPEAFQFLQRYVHKHVEVFKRRIREGVAVNR